jgi:hypothetical protein
LSFFSKAFGGVAARDGDEGEAADAEVVESGADPDNSAVDPDIICADASEPTTADCLGVQVSTTDFSSIDLSFQTCKTSGNQKWCDLFEYVFESCQVGIGWDTTANKGKDPFVRRADIGQLFVNNLDDPGNSRCNMFAQDVSGTSGSTPWRFCIKRTGLDGCG